MMSSSKFQQTLRQLSKKKSRPLPIGHDLDAARFWKRKGLQGTGRDKKYFEKGIRPAERVAMIRSLMPRKTGEQYNSQRLRWLDEVLDLCITLDDENVKLRRRISSANRAERRREARGK